MGTDIAIRDHKIPKGCALEKSEHELAKAMLDQFEAFYRQGVVLERIKNEKEFQDANYTSFDEYMNERQPLGIKQAHAWRLIAAKNIRPLLPELDSPMGESVWTERAVRPLTHKDFSRSDVRRLGKKIATQVRKGVPLSDTLVKRICDEDRGVESQKTEKAAAKLDAADTPAKVLQRIRVEAELWQSSLAAMPEDFWSDAESEDEGCLRRTISALSDLVSFLRS